MNEKITQFIHEHNLIEVGDTVAVGVSGGADSLALLHYFLQKRTTWNLKLIAVHIDHMFRGEQSKEDRLFVEEFCRKHNILCESTSIHVAAYQKEAKVSTQVASRTCRYAFYEEIMERYGVQKLALGHHGDDQIETILMRLVRGATLGGYSGIKIQRNFATGQIIRPMLAITKEEIENYCKEHHLTPRLDSSNESNTYTRNRFRTLLPFFKKENPAVHEKFLQFGEQIAEDEEYLQELAKAELDKIIMEKQKESLTIKISLLQSLAKPLQRRCIQLILSYLYQKNPATLSYRHLVDIFALFRSHHPSGELHLPDGLQVKRSYDEGIFTFLLEEVNLKMKKLPFHGEVAWEGHTFLMEVTEKRLENVANNQFLAPTWALTLPLFVRTREQGDRMSQKGRKGTRKLKDIFIDQKIPREEREKLPVMIDSKGEILWVPFVKKSSLEEAVGESYIVITYEEEKQ